jgi:hypothetical protein
MNRCSALLVAALCVLCACSSHNSKSSSDAGNDAGGIRDAGKQDGAVLAVPDTGVHSGIDAGHAPGCGNTTRDFLFGVPTPRCTAKTHDCVLACETAAAGAKSACRSACIKADQHAVDPSASWASCDTCISSKLLACGNKNGCSTPTTDFFCCIEEKCPSGSASGCTSAMCGSHVTDAVACIYAMKPDCLDYTKPAIGACFETMDAQDGGVSDAGN